MINQLTYENAYQQFKNEFKDDTDFFKERETETGVMILMADISNSEW